MAQTRRGAAHAVTYGKKDTRKLIRDVRSLLAECRQVEMVDETFTTLVTAEDAAHVWERLDGRRGVSIFDGEETCTIRPESVDELAVYD